METDLPKLIWMKRRIDNLLQASKDKDAIALAEKANLVCRGAAFIAWDEAEKVPVAQDEVYQPSLHVESGLMFATQRRASSSYSVREIIETKGDSASDFLGSRVMGYYRKAVLEPCSDKEFVSNIFDVKKKCLTEQLEAIIASAFCSPDSKKLVSIMQDWAKHTDEKQVHETLCALLRECERDRDAGYLRRVLSDFFLALPGPWKTKASSILAAQTPG